MTCFISQLTPSFSARPPRNEICREDVWSAGPPCLLATAQPQRPWPLTEFPSPTGEPPGSSPEAPHTSRKVVGGAAPGVRWRDPFRGGGAAGSSGRAWGGGDRLTHRVQLPLEYDEGHETDNDKYRAEAQVGKEVAREITWENGMRTEHEPQRGASPVQGNQHLSQKGGADESHSAGPGSCGHLSQNEREQD